MRVTPAHIVIATVGSLGDLFPFLAIGQALNRRGHRVTIATHDMHREHVERAGLLFAKTSQIEVPDDREAYIAKAFHPWKGPRIVVHDVAALDVAASYSALVDVCKDADLLLTSTLAFAAQIIAEQGRGKKGIRWLSAVLAPAGFISAYDPPATGWRWVDSATRASPVFGKCLRQLAILVSRPWTLPVRKFRRSLGMPAVSPLGDPFHSGQHSPDGVLSLFSSEFAHAQADWPARVCVAGFPRHRQATALDPALQQFLAQGAPPLVFTLGSVAIYASERFLLESFRAALQLGMRAVLLTGSSQMRHRLPEILPASIFAIDYAAHSALFPFAAAIVHHAGIGTSSEALHAGRPTLAVPHGFDQFDNAARLKRLEVAEICAARRYTSEAIAPLLRGLIEDRSYAERAAVVADRLSFENGAETAADRVEAELMR